MDSEFLLQNWMGEVFKGNLNFQEAGDLMEHRVQLLRCSGGIDKCLIMVGGLPGSGKTCFASDIHTCCMQLGGQHSPSGLGWEIEILAESDFFQKQGIPFDMERLEEAQAWTYARFEEVFERTYADVIVVECIHLTPDQYERYVAGAKEHGVPTLWVQFVCDSLEQAESLGARADLQVPSQVVARWYNSEYAEFAFGNSEQGLILVAPKGDFVP